MKKPEKIDLSKEHRNEYVAPSKPVLIEVKPAVYLAIDGKGEPGGEAFQECIGALYSMAFTIKMTRKFAGLQDYAVGRLEATYWLPDGSEDFAAVPKDQWCWTFLIRTPEFIGKKDLDKAVAALMEKGKSEAVRRVELRKLKEGRCVQMLHVGPYDREGETAAKMRAFAEGQGLRCCGHHEIYISDPRRVPPERLKTILRMPVRGAR